MHKYFFWLFFCGVMTFAQEVVQPIHSEINNKPTAKHVEIKGTRMSVIPPVDFIPSKKVRGFEKEKLAQFQLREISTPFPGHFERDYFDQLDYPIIAQQKIKVQDYPGEYIIFETKDNFQHMWVIFGDDKFTARLTSYFPKSQPQLKQALIESINSVYLNSDQTLTPLDLVDFEFRNPSKFEYTYHKSTFYFYTLDQTPDAELNEEPYVMVTQILAPPMALKEVVEFNFSNAQNQGVRVQEIEEEGAFELNGYEAYQIKAFANLYGEKMLIHLMAAQLDNKMVLLHFETFKDFEEIAEEFDKLTAGLYISE